MLNDHLPPLRRLLDRQVGRSRGGVQLEIYSNLRVTGTVQQEVRNHIRDFVAISSHWRRSKRGDFCHESVWGVSPGALQQLLFRENVRDKA